MESWSDLPKGGRGRHPGSWLSVFSSASTTADMFIELQQPFTQIYFKIPATINAASGNVVSSLHKVY